MRKNITKAAVCLSALLAVAACDDAAKVADRNITRAADNFEVHRRVVFINGITGQYLLTIEGLCALSNGETGRSVRVTCKTGPSEFLRHQVGLSDNVTFMAEQLRDVQASQFRYRVTFNPLSAIPQIEMRTPAGNVSTP